ncbi:MAG: hypothetical protein F6K56_21630 [Moorea sp. SIO3G5]|nr:hypothetical protein [Moorena sp. SIO3G5]
MGTLLEVPLVFGQRLIADLIAERLMLTYYTNPCRNCENFCSLFPTPCSLFPDPLFPLV